MRKYFLFKHDKSELGDKTMTEVYSLADILHLLSLTGRNFEDVRIMPKPFKVRNMNYEWAEGAYQIVGMCNGYAKCIGVTNFKE